MESMTIWQMFDETNERMESLRKSMTAMLTQAQRLIFALEEENARLKREIERLKNGDDDEAA